MEKVFKQLAPVLLFAFKRLETLKRTVMELANNYLASESELYVFSDEGDNTVDRERVKQVREYLSTISGFKSIYIVHATENKGLANSIISGTTEIFKTYDKAIVVEDDLFTTKNFLAYMNSALDKYENESNVFSICGYSFNIISRRLVGECDAYFINRGWPWGWATWKDRWNNIDWDMNDYSFFVSNLPARKAFSRGGSDLNAMLRKQMQGKLDSWAIRWYYHQFKVNGLSLYPVFSKVYNNGFDEFATHTKGYNGRYKPAMDYTNKVKFKFPDHIEVNGLIQSRFNAKLSIPVRIISRTLTIVTSLFK